MTDIKLTFINFFRRLFGHVGQRLDTFRGHVGETVQDQDKNIEGRGLGTGKAPVVFWKVSMVDRLK